ncbi:SRPBCC domain-containing protein [Olivibacter sp. XZL3]|uniref:SRPBCC domain-containing protein n=1 Tax=Olivibacter sp. XZL3 TaxID=1735116 RepID=UPI001065C6E4|nr:SRPBCC domain-containing protein [Olivibacter sp. XZL3]
MKDFKKYFIIPSSPEEVYLALTVEQAIRLWTGDEVSMPNKPNSEFSLWDGNIVGKNLLFEEGKKIVQQWYFGDQAEPSIVTMKLHPHKKGTSLELSHTNIPETDYDDIIEGWQDVYMASLIDFFEGE